MDASAALLDEIDALAALRESRQGEDLREFRRRFPACSLCGKPIPSRLGEQGKCDVCGAPICRRCRISASEALCAKHASRSKGAPEAADPGAGRIARGEGSPRAAPEQPSRAAPGPEAVAAPKAGKDTEGKSPAAAKEGRQAVSPAQARLAEETFFRLVENVLGSLPEVVDPIAGERIRVKDWSKAASPRERRPSGRTSSVPPGGGAGAEMIYDLRKRGLGRKKGRVVIVARSIAPGEGSGDRGSGKGPVDRPELESLLNEASRQATKEWAWRLVVLASPTGWTAEARAFATGGGMRPFRDRLVSVALYDRDSGRFLLSELDEKLAPYREAFGRTCTA